MNIHAHPTKKIGAKIRPDHVKTCKLSKYIDLSKFPNPPPTVDWSVKAPKSTQLFKNDEIGDCAVAAYLHHKEIILQTAGLGTTFSDSTAVEIYKWATAEENNGIGYTPDDQNTDTGLVLVDFLESLRRRGLILAHAQIDLNNDREVQIARWLYGGIYRGFDLPEFAQDLENTWYIPKHTQKGKMAGGWGGHCVNDKARLADGSILITSWGKTITVKPDFLKAYEGDAHIIIHRHSPQAFNNLYVGSNHLALKDLQSDLNALKA